MAADDCVRLGIDDSGRDVALQVGDALCIDLPETPTTGFRWRLTKTDDPVVALDEDRFEVTDPSPGARGVRHFRFVAGCAGATVIDMQQRRQWDSDSQPEYTLRVTVHARTG
jgi:inhibitor of cysteine peptidase